MDRRDASLTRRAFAGLALLGLSGAGHMPMVAVNALEVLQHVKAAKLRVLAVLSATRSPIFPDVPSIAESGWPGFEASVWYGFVGPAGLLPAVVARLHAEVQKALATADVRERLAAAGSEKLHYEKLIRDARIQPD